MGTQASAPLARLCPSYIPANYSSRDQLASAIAGQTYDAIVPGCTDASYLACADLEYEGQLGIDTPEVVRQIFDKEKLRQLAGALKISQPAQFGEADALGAESIIIKPVDGFSGNGITRVLRPTAQTLRGAIDQAKAHSPSRRVLIEEFVAGQLYSHSAFLYNQAIRADFFVQEDCVDSPYAVDTSFVALDLSRQVQDQLRTSILRLAKTLDLKDGLIHTQFIVRDSTAYLLEITRRHPGDLYGTLIQYSTGFDYAVHYLNAFLPQPLGSRRFPNGPRLIIRHTVTAGSGLDLWSLRFHAPVMIREWVPLAIAGDRLSHAPQGRVAIMFLEAESHDQMRSIHKLLLTRSLYSFEGYAAGHAE